MSCPGRTYPYRTPKNHRVPIPRWMLKLPESITNVFISYIGLQQHINSEETTEAWATCTKAIQDYLSAMNSWSVSESFELLESNDPENSLIWVCYWSDREKYQAHLAEFSISSLYQPLPEPGRHGIGIWQETFSTEVSRLETNYSGLDYLPGLFRLPGAETMEHKLSAYWGAARDRIPGSAHDLFARPDNIRRPEHPVTGIQQYLRGTNHSNLVHIRSGQFWENCGQQEADAYEHKLEPTLRAGLQFLCENPSKTGAMAVRYLRNKGEPGDARVRKETCGSAFFTNLADLESWAHTHPSHLKIYRGAMSHYKVFGDSRLFRTWHEVCVIQDGDAKFEYLNCATGTGLMGYVLLETTGI